MNFHCSSLENFLLLNVNLNQNFQKETTLSFLELDRKRQSKHTDKTAE